MDKDKQSTKETDLTVYSFERRKSG